MIKHTQINYDRLASQAGWFWIGEAVPATSERTLWRCPKGHQVLMSYQYAQARGLHCKACLLSQLAVTVGNARDTRFVGGVPLTSDSRLLWQCTKGHQFERSLREMQTRKHACPVCIGLYPKTVQDYSALAQSIGYLWLGSELPKNTLSVTSWLCDKGHIWSARYNQLRRGKRCPHP